MTTRAVVRASIYQLIDRYYSTQHYPGAGRLSPSTEVGSSRVPVATDLQIWFLRMQRGSSRRNPIFRSYNLIRLRYKGYKDEGFRRRES